MRAWLIKTAIPTVRNVTLPVPYNVAYDGLWTKWMNHLQTSNERHRQTISNQLIQSIMMRINHKKRGRGCSVDADADEEVVEVPNTTASSTSTTTTTTSTTTAALTEAAGGGGGAPSASASALAAAISSTAVIPTSTTVHPPSSTTATAITTTTPTLFARIFIYPMQLVSVFVT